MTRPNIYKLEIWEIVLILSSVALLIVSSYYKEDIFIISTLIGTATCILTAILILYFQRIHRKSRLYSYYTLNAGEYIRIDIGQDNTGGIENTDIKEKNIDLEIKLIYEGENKFRALIQYWKHESAEALATLEFSEINKNVPDAIIMPVIYDDARVKIPVEKSQGIDPNCLLTKSKDWEYEQEERLLVSLSEASKYIKSSPFDIYLFEIPHSLIKEIIVGANITSINLQIIKQFCAGKNIYLYQSEISETKFDMVRIQK